MQRGSPIGISARAWAAGLLTLLASGTLSRVAHTEERPNVIIILADDLGYGDVGCFQRLHPGKRDVKTPSIDALARNGIVLTDFYAHPVCTPARYCLLTGRHLARSPDLRDLIVLDYDFPERGLRQHETTMAEVFKAADYATAIVGKWHLGSGKMVVEQPPTPPFSQENEFHPNAHGFDYFSGFLGGSIDYCTHQKRGRFFDWYENRTLLFEDDGQGGNAHPDEGRYATHLVTEKAVELIDRFATAGQPFFLYVPYPAPHWAQTPTQQSLQVHQLPNEETDSASPRYRYYLKQFDHIYPGGDDTNWRKRLLAMVKALDDGVGAIMDKLSERGIEENTIVVFTSDNGGETAYGPNTEIAYGSSNGPFTRGDKASLYEGGIRVPAIIQFKGRIPAQSTTSQLASIVDLKVTLGRLAGIDTTAHPTDGIDLSPALENPGQLIDRDFFYYSGHFGKVYRRGRWKLLERRLDGTPQPSELYDVIADSDEKQNLAHSHREVLQSLKKLHAEMLREALSGNPAAPEAGRTAQ